MLCDTYNPDLAPAFADSTVVSGRSRRATRDSRARASERARRPSAVGRFVFGARVESKVSSRKSRVDDRLDWAFHRFIDSSIHSRTHGRVRVDGEEEARKIRAYIVDAS